MGATSLTKSTGRICSSALHTAAWAYIPNAMIKSARSYRGRVVLVVITSIQPVRQFRLVVRLTIHYCNACPPWVLVDVAFTRHRLCCAIGLPAPLSYGNQPLQQKGT